MDVHPDDGFALAEDMAFEEDVARSLPTTGPEGRPLGVAFLLGVVVGVTASALFRGAAEEDRSAGTVRRSVRRRRGDEEPPSLSRVVQDEAALVARAVLRDLGSAASSWILEGLASRPREEASESTEGAESGP